MSHVEDVIVSKPRTGKGKGAARQLRAQGWVPAVAYGPSSEPRHLAVDSHVLMNARRQYGRAHVYNVNVEGGGSFKAFIKELTIDPVSRHVLHLDLYEIDPKRPVTTKIRIDLVGKARGVAMGGSLQQVMRTIKVVGLAEKIPEFLTLDISEMDQGDILFEKDLTLPDGVEFAAPHNEPVAKVTGAKAEAKDEETEEAAGDAAAKEKK